MKKIWLVFWQEYSRHVMKKRFLVAVLSMPIFIIAIMAASILSVAMNTSTLPLGYVDQSGVLAHATPPTKAEGSLFEQTVALFPYANEGAARTALDANQIQAYYLLYPDYLQSGKAKLVYTKQPSDLVRNQFDNYLRTNLMAGQPEAIAKRISDGTSLVIQSADGSRQMDNQSILTILLPIVVGVLIMIVVLTTGGYLLQALVEEKENRTIEILVTSTSPGQLMAGKTLGNLGAGLTQLLIWILVVVVAIAIGRSRVEWMQGFQISPDYLWIMLLTLLPTFIMIGGIMAAIGATMAEAREAQQISGIFTLPLMMPYWFTSAIMTAPNGPLAIGFSFFPLTAPVTLTLRAGYTQIPTMQLAINLVELWVCAILALWVAARAFRIGMLSYGKRISLKQILRRAS